MARLLCDVETTAVDLPVIDAGPMDDWNYDPSNRRSNFDGIADEDIPMVARAYDASLMDTAELPCVQPTRERTTFRSRVTDRGFECAA